MKTEKLKHKEAFEYYYSLGDKRTLKQVAEKFEVSDNSARKWSHYFNWQQRIIDRDEENAKKLEKKTNTSIVQEKAKYRKIIQDSINSYMGNLDKGNIEITNVADLEKLIKLDLLLMGEATDKQKIEYTGDVKQRLIDKLVAIRKKKDEPDG
jgi:uncharacterized protein YjcR